MRSKRWSLLLMILTGLAVGGQVAITLDNFWMLPLGLLVGVTIGLLVQDLVGR